MIDKLNEIYNNPNIIRVISKKLKVSKEKVMDSYHDVYIIISDMIKQNKNVDITEGYVITTTYRHFLKNQDNYEELDFEIIDIEDEYNIKKDILSNIIINGEQTSEELYLINCRMYKLENQETTSKKMKVTKNQLYYKQRNILKKIKNKIEIYDII